MRYIKAYKLFESNNLDDILTKDEFPTEEYIKDFFLDLLDELPDISFSLFRPFIYTSGYVSFSTDYIYKSLHSQLLYDMSFEDNWINKEVEEVQDTWKNILLPIQDIKRTLKRFGYYPIYTTLDSLKNDEGKFEDKFYENIINGNIPAYPFIELSRIYFDIEDKEKLDLLYESLSRLYEVTEFRPIGDFHSEDFVDEDSGEVVNLYIANIKLFKCNDVEYKNLIKSKVLVNNPEMLENKEMTQKFL